MDDEDEKKLRAEQFKAQCDLNERQTKEWGKYQQQLQEYSQLYGSATAQRLLKKQREELEATFDKQQKALSEQRDSQWLAHENNKPDTIRSQNEPTKDTNTIKAQLKQEQKTPDPAPSITDEAARILEKYRKRQQERKDRGIEPEP